MTIDLHYCQHRLYDIGIFSSAKSCCSDPGKGMASNRHDHSCCMHGDHLKTCKNEKIIIHHVDDYVVTSDYNSLQDHPEYCDLFAVYNVLPENHWSGEKYTCDIPEPDISPPYRCSKFSFLQSFLL